MIKNFKWLLLVSLTLVACSSDDEAVVNPDSSDGLPLTAGSADFSKYVALGDSFAAGFSDNALFIEGQKGAYPNILAQQFALVGGGEFTTPLMADNVGGFLGSSTYFPRLYLAPPTTPGGSPSPSSVALPPYSQTSSTTFASLGSTFNNMGIPGAKVTHLLAAGYGSSAGNPYFARFASNPATTVLADALAQNPTFFSLWIGGNDVLGYATSGGLNPADITAPSTFDTAYNTLASQLAAGGRKGVVANLPYVSTLPYFTTVPYNPVPLDAATAAQLNAGYTTYNNGLLFAQSNGLLSAAEVAQRTISFSASSTNKVVIVDEYLTNLTGFGIPSYRQATSEDLIVLSARNFIGTTVGGNPLQVNGISVPLADQWVLSKNEIEEVRIATDAYNQTIQTAATNNDLAFVDAKAIMTQLSTVGITANNFTLNSTYVTGGAFSLDGVHPSPRGYALIANEFLKSINTKYGSNIKGVSFADYRIMFPPVLP
ncbi:MAG: G-D-S-L family lipolytic protein [Flavobacterium sp. JAD_PAG50586_2]|nr:MAG: G-D-S-L family lipolytic protein [Flavobacterium sp. JAD_PAG50586_2]